MASPAPRTFHPDASLVLVGGRGAGKKTLGFCGATHLRRRLLTEDHYFEQSVGCSRAQFMQRFGKDAFRQRMTLVLAQILQANPSNCVIECGTATMCREVQVMLQQYGQTKPVIYVHRDMADIDKVLGRSMTDAERLFHADQSYRAFTNLEYYNLYDASGADDHSAGFDFRMAAMTSARLLQVKEDFANFLDVIFGQSVTRSWMENPFSIKAIPPEYRPYSFILRLPLSLLIRRTIDWVELEAGGDAVELVIDCWPENRLDVIAEQVALIRRHLDLPIAYHVEEMPLGEGARAQEVRDAAEGKMLLLHGLRLGVEYLSIELEKASDLVGHVLSARGRTKIIGDVSTKGSGVPVPQWSGPVYLEHYQRAQRLGCSIVRFVSVGGQERDKRLRQMLVDVMEALPEPKPLLVAHESSVTGLGQLLDGTAVDEGEPGPTLRDMKLVPVGHAALESSTGDRLKAANTARGLLRAMFTTGLLSPLKFYTLGSKVYYSASPAMHKAAYERHMMPHTFEARQCTELDDVDKLRREGNFGGASLTAPFKVAIMSRIDHVSAHATAIGAVNTLLPLRGQTWSILDHANARNTAGSTSKCYGDNTDWSAIVTCLRRAISPRNAVQSSRTTGLVIGAGGMARAAIYALIKLGCRKVFIYNRTVANADKVAQHFNDWASTRKLSASDNPADICHVLHSTAQEWPQAYQYPTMIVSCIAAAANCPISTVEFQLPPQWLRSATGGVVVELAYEPLITMLITQMRRLREGGATFWVVVNGLEVVCEMASEAFELMTGRKAPRTLMRTVCAQTWERNRAAFGQGG